LALQVHITNIFTILLWSNNALERPRIADLTQESLHPQWTDIGRDYGVTVVKTEQYGWALVAKRSFRPLEPICPYSDFICASESDLDYKLQLLDGRYCDGNLVGQFANDYPSEDDWCYSNHWCCGIGATQTIYSESSVGIRLHRVIGNNVHRWSYLTS
jgi:hypothetical protein